jgi:hypothetical protein
LSEIALQKRIAELNESGKMADIYKNCFNTEAGRMVLEDMKMRMFYFTTDFDVIPSQHAFNTGQLAALKYILAQLEEVEGDSAIPERDS